MFRLIERYDIEIIKNGCLAILDSLDGCTRDRVPWATILMGCGFPNVPAWLFATFFALIIFSVNALSVRSFGEAESFFVSIKVIAIIILGLGAMFGLVSFDGKHKAILFTNLTAGAFPKGIVAGEMDNPKEAVLKAIKPMIGRLVIFFVLTIVVLASLLPMKEVGSSIAPFIDVFDKIGIPFAADIMNFVILTAILSAGNSGLYASSRMLWSLANEGMLSKKVVKINEHGVPMRPFFCQWQVWSCHYFQVFMRQIRFILPWHQLQ